jgi:hypothetical protein
VHRLPPGPGPRCSGQLKRPRSLPRSMLEWVIWLKEILPSSKWRFAMVHCSLLPMLVMLLIGQIGVGCTTVVRADG